MAETPTPPSEIAETAPPAATGAADAPAPAAPAAPEGAAELDALRVEIEHWKQQAADSHDQALRARAELDNLRKRTARDIESAHKYALDRFVGDLLPVLDSFELGVSASRSATDVAALVTGMELTLKMLGDCLARFGVTAVDPAGGRFDPERHRAIASREEPGAEPGTVLSVMQKGYELNGRLVRPALVVVAK